MIICKKKYKLESVAERRTKIKAKRVSQEIMLIDVFDILCGNKNP